MIASPRHRATSAKTATSARPRRTPIAAQLALLAAFSCSPLAHAISSCTSDGQPQPLALYERFISADCETCWAESPALAPGPTALVADWIVPSAQGDDAPLSAAATRDALERLQDLGRTPPARTDTHISPVEPARTQRRTSTLRVAHGPVFNDYVGTGIQWPQAHASTSASGPYRFTLLLAEAVPAGTEGSPVARNLVRNMLQGSWNADHSLPKREQKQRGNWMENRPMRVPDGTPTERLRLLGWVTDAQGRVVAAAQSLCR